MRGSAPVTINARAGVREELGGVERYATELASRLPALNPARYRTLTPRPSLAHRAGHAWEQLAVPLLAGGAGLIYSPANLAPLLTGARNVIVIHDTAPFVTPQAYSRAYRTYHRGLAAALARRARHVITVSAFSQREIVRYLGVPADRISVIPPGVDRDRFRADAAAAGRTKAALGLNLPYVLAVGTGSARKNHGVLTPAAAALAERGIELVVAGGERDYLSVSAAPSPARLRRLGYVEEDLLPGLYAGALALAMPSIHEGFGLPCIEAMASGTPVVAAAAGALPETCRDAALLLDPHDAAGFTRALLSLATPEADRDRVDRLRAQGLRRAAHFDWDAAATQTDALLTALLG